MIRQVLVHVVRQEPVEAILDFVVYPERLSSRTLVQGRFVGPRCAYATTVEVAYPFREWSRQYESEGTPCLNMRVVVPEPNMWEPQTPFLYQASLELLENGQPCDRAEITYGLRSLKLGQRSLLLNGHPFIIRGVVLDHYSDSAARRCREAGINTILARVSRDSAALWDSAERSGFFVLGSIPNRENLHQAHELQRKTSSLGWVLTVKACKDELMRIAAVGLLGEGNESLLGCILDRPEPGFPLEGFNFVLCNRGHRHSQVSNSLARIIGIDEAVGDEARALESTPGILGWVKGVIP
jgi:hypothetical protein